MHLSTHEILEQIKAAALAGDLTAASLRDSLYAASDHLARKWGECQDAQRASDDALRAAELHLQSTEGAK